jgi:hypothetical protein
MGPRLTARPTELRSRATRIRLNALLPWQAGTIIWAALSLLLSGVAWQLVLFRRGPEGLPGPIEPWLARWHGLSSMAALFASRHVPRGLALGNRLRSGLSVVVLFAVLALTGFSLAYLVPESWRSTLGWTHSALGVLAFTLGAVHRR